MSIRFIIISFLSVFLFFSCSIEKRKHRKGYHIQWNKQIPATASHDEPPVEVVTQAKSKAPSFVASKKEASAQSETPEYAFNNINQHVEKVTQAKADINVSQKKSVSPTPSNTSTKTSKNKKKLENKEGPILWERLTIFSLERQLRGAIVVSVLLSLLITLVINFW